ncbi:UNVERIFIED_ORG: hypothetical protein LHJ69_23005 [Shinella sp. XGS7]|jgi:hypothetical protein|nr:hypothetical protein [Shinella sp. XGS7]
MLPVLPPDPAALPQHEMSHVVQLPRSADLVLGYEGAFPFLVSENEDTPEAEA